MQPSHPQTPSPRWWPAVLILASAIAGIVLVRSRDAADHQQATVLCMGVVVVAALLLLLWLVAFSRLVLRTRLLATVGYLGAIGGFLLLFRLDGFSGDLVPIFTWRFGTVAAPAAVPTPPAAPASTPVSGLADFPQFFGPDRTGQLAGPRLATDWQARPPAELWRRPVGAAWSGFAVVGRRAITQEQHGAEEAVVCYDAITGAVSWVHRDTARYESPVAGTGPRATPTVVGDRVLTQGATGILNCLRLVDGVRLWSVDILADAKAERPEWGVAGSPLVFDGLVVVQPGGKPAAALVAYDLATGGRRWGGGSDRAHWSTPVRVRLAGRDQVLAFGAAGVSGYDAGSGAVLWQKPWRGGHPHVAMPMLVGSDRVLIASGYGTGAELVRVTGRDGRFEVRSLWKRLTLKAKFANFVVRGGHAYGFDDGVLTCIELASGRRAWKRGRYGHGQLLAVGELLLVTTEQGEVVLVDAVPAAHRERARLRVFEHKTWNPPALAGRFLLVRNDKHAACLRLPVAD